VTNIESDVLLLRPVLPRLAQEPAQEEEEDEVELADIEAISCVSRVVESPAPRKTCPTLVSRTSPPPLKRRPEPTVVSERPALAAGVTIGGRFVLEARIGAGGMGEVWAAEDARTSTRVAVKVLLPRASWLSQVVARFEREAVLLGRAQNEHTPRLVEYLIDEVYGPVLVTELIDGQSLADAIKAPLSVEQAVDLGIELATALAALHDASIVHRDFKPSNVLFRSTLDGQARAVIIDFGISRLVHEDDDELALDELTTADVVLGTIEYMAPEQILRCAQVTAGADLYALGAVLFRAITGGHVFGPGLDKMELVRTKLTAEAPPLRTERHDPTARELAKVVARALERNPAARYQSAAELRADLLRLRAMRPLPSPRPSSATPARRHVLAAVMAFAVLAGAVVSTLLDGSEPGMSRSAQTPVNTPSVATE
jgi:eukaryotic-like serine/threonine-protein kinase